MSVELADVVRFLATTAPFDALDASSAGEFATRLTERYFRRGTEIVAPGDRGVALYVVRSGAVEVLDPSGTLLDTRDVGECFGHSTINDTGPSRYRMVAVADTLALVVPKPLFDDVAARFPEIREFFDAQSVHVRRDAVTARMEQAGGDAMSVPVAELIARAPVTIGVDAAIRTAAETMTTARVSCLLAVGGDGAVVGILTDRDLRSRVLAAGVDPGRPVADVMTPGPTTVSGDTTAFDAALSMMEAGINHLPVVDDGVPLGLVTATDLVRLSHTDPIFLAARIARARSVDEVRRLMGTLPELTFGLSGRRVAAERIGKVLTAAADAATRRLIALAHEDLGPAPMAYCWVAVGSQARGELGVASDQDNALVLECDPDETDAAYFQAFAERVNSDLAAVGLPRCPGRVEASNPEWRKTPSTWAAAASHWAGRPEADAVLDAQIFFDMRAVAGNANLCEDARAGMLGAAQASPRFHARLAAEAAGWRPPLGFFRGLVVEKRGEHRNSLDVKAGGIAAVVQLARLAALAGGLTEVSTTDRLDAAVAAGRITESDAGKLAWAYATLRDLQIRHHAECVRAGREPDNHLAPAALSAWDRRDLRNAFGVIAGQLDALALRYPIRQM